MLSGIGIGTLWFLPVLFISYTILCVLVISVMNRMGKYPVEKTLIKMVFENAENNVQEWIRFVVNLLSTIAVVYGLKDKPVQQRLVGKEKSEYGIC